MVGIFYAILGGAFITLQGVANSRISQNIGTWQTATLTQFTGFIAALLIVIYIRDKGWRKLRHVRAIYQAGGSFAALIIYNNITAIHRIGVTLTISAVLIAQLALTFIIDSNGWFGMEKKKIKLPHLIGIGMMIAGIVILKL